MNLNNDNIKYRVIVDGQVLNESTTMALADMYVNSLSEEQKQRVKIVPFAANGQQILNG